MKEKLGMDEWLTKTIEFKEKQRLHLRPAVKISQAAEKFTAEIRFALFTQIQCFNAKSITDLILFVADFAASEGDTFELKARGVDAEAALIGIANLLETSLFDEEDKN